MTADEYQAEAADAAARTARFERLTNQAETTGVIFDYAAPLPKQPTYRPREWEADTKEQR